MVNHLLALEPGFAAAAARCHLVGWDESPRIRREDVKKIYEFHQEYVFIDTYLACLIIKYVNFTKLWDFSPAKMGRFHHFTHLLKGGKKWGVSPTKRGLTQQN